MRRIVGQSDLSQTRIAKHLDISLAAVNRIITQFIDEGKVHVLPCSR